MAGGSRSIANPIIIKTARPGGNNERVGATNQKTVSSTHASDGPLDSILIGKLDGLFSGIVLGQQVVMRIRELKVR